MLSADPTMGTVLLPAATSTNLQSRPRRRSSVALAYSLVGGILVLIFLAMFVTLCRCELNAYQGRVGLGLGNNAHTSESDEVRAMSLRIGGDLDATAVCIM